MTPTRPVRALPRLRPERRPVLRSRLGLVALIGLPLAFAIPPAAAQFSFLGLQNNLVDFVLDQISVPGEFEIEAEGVEQPDDGSTAIVGLTIADADGVWLRIGRTSLDWSAGGILSGTVQINSLAAEEVEYLRAPSASVEIKDDAEIASDDEEDGEDGGLFEWPRAPLTVIVDEMRLDRVTIAPGAVAQQGFSFDALGNARDEGDVQALKLEVTRTDGVSGRILVDYRHTFDDGVLDFRLEADEAAGGLVAELAGLPNDGASRALITANGPLTDWDVDLSVSSDDVISVEGGARIGLGQPLGVTADLAVSPGPDFDPGIARLLGTQATLALAVVEGDDGIIRVERGALQSPALQASATGFVDRAGPLDLAVSLNADPGVLQEDAALAFERLSFEGQLGGTADLPVGEGNLDIAGLTSASLDIGAAQVTASLSAEEAASVFALDGNIAGLRLDRLTPRILGDALLAARGRLEGDVLRLSTFRLETRPLTVEAEGVADSGAGTLDFRYRASAPRLAPLATAYDANAEGAFVMEGRLVGEQAAPRLAGEIALTDLTFEDEAYGAVALAHDATFGTVPEGDIALTAEGSRFGPARISTAFALQPDTLELTEMTLAALDATIAGAIDLDLSSTLMAGEITLDIPSLARAEAATGLELQGQGSGTVTLSTETVEQAFGTTERQQVADIDLSFRDFAGFEATVAALGIEGRMTDLLGDPGGDLTITLGDARHPQGRVGTGTLDATLVSLTRRGSVDLDLDLARISSPGLVAIDTVEGLLSVKSLDKAPSADAELVISGIASPAVEGGATVRRARVTARMADLDTAPAGPVTARIEDIAAMGYALDRVEAEATLVDLTGAAAAEGQLRVIDLDGPDAALDRATVDFDMADLAGDPGGTVKALIEGLAAPAADAAVSRIEADATLATLTSAPAVQATAAIQGMEAAGNRIARVEIEADASDLTGTGRATARITATDLAGAASASRVTVDADMSALNTPAGTVALRMAGLAAGGAQIGEARLDATLTDRAGRTDVDARAAVPSVAAEGARVDNIRLTARIADALGTPSLDTRIDIAAIEAGDIAIADPVLTARGPLSRLALALDATGEALGKALAARLRAEADVDGPLDARVSELTVGLDEAEIALGQPLRIRQQGTATDLSGLDLRLPGGALTGDVALYPNGAGGAIALDFGDLGQLRSLVEAIPITAGTVDLDTRFDTRRGRASATLTGTARDIATSQDLGTISGVGLDLDGRWDGRSLASTVALSGPFGDPVRVEAAVPLVATSGPAPALNENGPLSASVDWQGQIGRLWVLVPAPDHVLDGDVDVALRIGGTPAAPTISGDLGVARGQYQNLETGTILTDLTVTSRLEGTENVALDVSANDGASGKLAATIALAGPELDAKVDIDDAVLVRRDDVTAQISADIAAAGPLTALDLSGELRIDRAEVRLVNAVPPSVADLGEIRFKGEEVEEGDGGAGGDITLDLAIRAPQDVFVRGRGLNSEWAINLDIAGTAAAPRITGAVESRRGELDLLGKFFALEPSEVVFSGGRVIDPRLDVSLSHENQGITGFIRVRGTGSSPEILFESDPALPEDEVLPRVLFGRSAQSLSGLEALQLASAVATLLDGTGGTADQIRGAVGLDVLRVETTEGGSTAVVVGRNVSEGVFVGAEQPIDGGETKVQVEIDVFSDFTVDGEVGGTTGPSVGLNWRKDF
ncbi:MAG: translocation/assembly module TamB domain-containing protein [Pseudomonadota bacterium]